MHLLEYPLQNLPVLPKIMQDYLSGNLENTNLHGALPNIESLIHQAETRLYSPALRKVLVNTLEQQYGDSPRSNTEQFHLDALLDENTFTITTGHQICLLTGPLYFIYKIATVVNLCRALNVRSPDKKFVPLFWMATEDHDFEEINHVFQSNEKLVWDSKQSGAVGRMNTHGLTYLLKDFEEKLDDDVKNSDLWRKVKDAYLENTLADATRELVRAFFGNDGVVVLNADDHNLKMEFLPQLERELFEDSVRHELDDTSKYLIENGYKAQVNPREINIFYLCDEGRDRLVKVKGGFEIVGGNKRWTRDEMQVELNRFPERFSPNVILRPLYQECILPNIAYIGGPGEISYWLQLKKMFDVRTVDFPILILRSMGMVFPWSVQKRCDKLGLSNEDVFKSYDALVAQCLRDAMPDFERYSKEFNKQFDLLESTLKDVDSSLMGAVAAEKQKLSKAVDKLKSKTLKSLKRKDEASLKRISFIKDTLFRGGVPQERISNIFEILEFVEKGFMDFLMKSCNPLDFNYRFFMVDTTDKDIPNSIGERG